MNIKRALKSIAKGVSTFAGPLGAPIESILSFYEDNQTQEREAQLDAMIFEVQSLNRETLEEIFQAREEIKELRAQFILAMEICFSILAENRKLLFSPDLEQNIPFFLESYKEQLEASGLITNDVL